MPRLLGATALAVTMSLAVTALTHGQSNLFSEASIRGHMEFLAGDALQGRGSGTHDEQLAANYIGAQMRRWGIEPLGDDGGYVQQIATTRPTPQSPPVLMVQGLTFRSGADFSVAGFNAAVPSGQLFKFEEGKPVPPGSFVLLPQGTSIQQANTTGAAGVLALPGPPPAPRAGGPATGVCGGSADAAGAGGRQGGGAGVAGGGGRGTAPGPAQWRITLSAAAFEKINGLAAGAPVSVFADMQSLTWNAIGRLKGSDPKMADDVILLTAHLDHLGVRGIGEDYIFNGADDDASGSTAVLALAEAIAKSSRPKRTVIFAWFGSEEVGGFGARHFLNEPPVPLKNIVANLEFEMLGREDPLVPAQSLWLTGFQCSDLGETLARRGARIVQDPRPEQRFFNRSDNIQLARRGVVAQTVSSFNLHTDYHRASDEVKTIDFAHMTRSIQSMFEPVLWLANSTFRPKWREGMCPLPCGGH